MTREEEIKIESVSYNEKRGKLNVIGGSNMLSDEEFVEFNKNPDFINGALWADEHPYEKFVSDGLEKANKIYKGGKLMFVSVDEVERIKTQFINKAAEWLNENIYQYVFWDTENYEIYVSKIELINHLTRELSLTLKTDYKTEKQSGEIHQRVHKEL